MKLFILIAGAALFGTSQVWGQAGSVRFSNPTYEVSESSAAAIVTVFRTNGDDGAISVTVVASAGTATAGTDFVPASTVLVWPDNDDDPRTVAIELIDDELQESTETVLLELQNVTGGAGVASPNTAVLSILDDGDTGQGAGEVGLASSTFVAAEGEAASVVLRRTGGSAGMVSIQWATFDGTATAGLDYVADEGVAVWEDGDSSDKLISVTTLDDDLLEGDETFSVVLSLPSGGVSVSRAESTVIVADTDVSNDGPCVADDSTLCLGASERFRVQVRWRTANDSGEGTVATLDRRDSGLFWFFNEDNIEMLVKVLDACGLPQFQTFWVFYAATTNVGFDLIVTDTVGGRTKIYSNTVGHVADPVTDTGAFDTCGAGT
ncbi:MAG: hypothetical protein KDB69_10215 [Acidimicrobiia bacterium]|nr:hypothetical protein [Acidimicrobiia bacterium]